MLSVSVPLLLSLSSSVIVVVLLPFAICREESCVSLYRVELRVEPQRNSLGIPTLAAMLGDMCVEYVFCPRKGTKRSRSDGVFLKRVIGGSASQIDGVQLKDHA